MTRREEIINNIGYKMTRAALEYVEKHEFADAIDAFEAGAEWANKTMIEKACEWLYNQALDGFYNEDGTNILLSDGTKEKFIKSFKKAMEE